ncbi:HET-domain-containing protein [Stipitochalara longipes BDJ]|nr:HET-domain-containing protein [Stipitochalara longipes BDJ]
MPGKPKPMPGNTHKKRKRDDVASTSGGDGNPGPLNKIIEREKKKLLSQTANDQSVGSGDEVEDDGRVSSTKLVHHTLHEAENIYPTILPRFIPSSTAQSKRTRLAKSNLCGRCAKIDLDTLLSRSHKTQAGQAAKKLSPVSSWKKTSCPLCSLFYSTMSRPRSTEIGEQVPLRTYSSNKMEDKVWSSISTNLLQVGYTRYIVSQPEGAKGPVKIIKDKIGSFECIKDWIGLCTRQHKMCNLETRSSIPSQKLIDCETGVIVPGQDLPYVALSYVWGLSSDKSEDPNRLPAKLPNTIQDAMTVTKRLGYRYLWVDRYCIDQENKQETDDQVGKMDVIYKNAELTIIAAIGKDPNYGLPGVSLRKREPKHLTTCAKIGKHFLISIDAYPKTAGEGTTWVTRAWTYQEALLSRRRLLFTEEQMYFECYGMYCCESLHLPLETLHRKDMQGFKSVFCSEKLVGIFPKGVGTTAIEIVRRIEEYSKRSLTVPSDILKGMLGIFHAFETGRLAIYHCAGIPLLPSMLERSVGKPIEGWTLTMGFISGIFWDLETISDRRHGFPSWSWTGWQGAVKWNSLIWPSITVDAKIQVKVEIADGQLAGLENFHIWSMHSEISNIVHTLHITAWTIDIKILGHSQKWDYWTGKRVKNQYEARLELEDGGHLEWLFELSSKVEVSSGSLCKGIILGHNAAGVGLIATRYLGVGSNPMGAVGVWYTEWAVLDGGVRCTPRRQL